MSLVAAAVAVVEVGVTVDEVVVSLLRTGE
jgi:hypothetical protein